MEIKVGDNNPGGMTGQMSGTADNMQGTKPSPEIRVGDNAPSGPPTPVKY